MCAPAGEFGRGGFTLVEALVAVSLIALAVVALVGASQGSTAVNAAGRELTQAAYLAQEIREWTAKLPFRDPDAADRNNPPGPDGTNPLTFVDDLDDLLNTDGAGVTYSPPRDACFNPLSGMTGWAQRVTVQFRKADSLLEEDATKSSGLIYVTVTVLHNNAPVLSNGYLVARRPGE